MNQRAEVTSPLVFLNFNLLDCLPQRQVSSLDTQSMRGAQHQHGDLAFDLGIGRSLQSSDERLNMEGPLVVRTSNQRKLPSANSLNIRFFQKVMFLRLWRMPLQPAIQTMKSRAGRNTRIGLRLGPCRLRHGQIGWVNRCYFCSLLRC